ncbi:MAG: LppX_LprAFG lipoprotein [Dehalococcoidia bacterium]|nr:LppX_LprAFG lipoprotein [Dehalococcoidia bacterium]
MAATALSCGSQEAPAPQSAAPTPTPRQLIEQCSREMTALDTVRFELVHEGDGSSQLFPGMVLTRVVGEVDMPDRFAVSAEAMSLFPRSFIGLDVAVSGDRALMTDFLNPAEWNTLPVESLPFDFANLGGTLSDIILSMEDPREVGEETVDGVPSRHIRGTAGSAALAALIPAAVEGYVLTMELWIGKERALLRQVRIEGQILSTDQPDLVRVLTIRDFDQPVNITLPQT